MSIGDCIAQEYNRQQAQVSNARALYFLSLREMGVSTATIAKDHGISRQRVNQLVQKAKGLRNAAL